MTSEDLPGFTMICSTRSQNCFCFDNCIFAQSNLTTIARVSVQGVESLWGDCRFIPADWGSQ